MHISFDNSSRTRSADTFVMRSAIAVMAATTGGSTSKLQLGRETSSAHHPQRVVGERILRQPGRSQEMSLEVAGTAERIVEDVIRNAHSHRVHGEVAAPQVFVE